jgi:hypothetical protein
MYFTHFCALFPKIGASWSSSLTHVRALIRTLISLSFLLSFQLSFPLSLSFSLLFHISFPLFLLGCHRSLCYCSPATSLRLRACHSFWAILLLCIVPSVPTVTPHLNPSYYLSLCKSRVFILYTPPECFRFTFPALHTLGFISFFEFSKTCAKPLCILHRSPTVSS